MFLNEPPPSHGGRRGKGADAARESPAKRLDRANPCGGERLMRDRCLFCLTSPFSSVSNIEPRWTSIDPFPAVAGRLRKRHDRPFWKQAPTASVRPSAQHSSRAIALLRAEGLGATEIAKRLKDRPRHRQTQPAEASGESSRSEREQRGGSRARAVTTAASAKLILVACHTSPQSLLDDNPTPTLQTHCIQRRFRCVGGLFAPERSRNRIASTVTAREVRH